MKKFSLLFLCALVSCAPKYTRIDEEHLQKFISIEASIRINLDDLYEKKLFVNRLLESKEYNLKATEVTKIKKETKILNALIESHEYALALIEILKARGSLTSDEYRKLLQFHLDFVSLNKFAHYFDLTFYTHKDSRPTPLVPTPNHDVESKESSGDSYKIETLRAYIQNKMFREARKLHSELASRVTSVEEARNLRELHATIDEGLQNEIERKIEEAESLVLEHKNQDAYDRFKEIKNTYEDMWPSEELRLKVENYITTLAAELEGIGMEQKVGLYDENKRTFDEAVAIYENAQNKRNLADALSKFEPLKGTTFEKEAQSYIRKTKDKLAGMLRTEAANLFLQARKIKDVDKRLEALIAALRLLQQINRDYPLNSIREKIEQNIEAVLKEIRAIDPAFES